MEIIGKVVAKLRKEKDITQDELAKALGISAQAVSKWENGGVPDTELLPRIADYFKISIDELFGRDAADYKDIRSILANKISGTEHQNFFEEVFEACFEMEQGMFFGNKEQAGSFATIQERQQLLRNDDQEYSTIITDYGFTRMGIANRLQYFLIVPEAEDKEKAFFNGISYTELFRDLSEKSVFDAILFLDKRGSAKSFTPNLLMNQLDVSYDKALEIIKILRKYCMIQTTQIELDDATQEVYSYSSTPSFCAMLIFARELIDKPNKFFCYKGGREKPYLS